jgi:hypothetical protein
MCGQQEGDQRPHAAQPASISLPEPALEVEQLGCNDWGSSEPHADTMAHSWERMKGLKCPPIVTIFTILFRISGFSENSKR